MPSRVAAFALIVAASAWPAAPAQAQKFVVLVRHAEKLAVKENDPKVKDPPLAAAGKLRAERLAALLAGSGIRAIHTSEYQRSVQTASAVARRLGVQPVVTPARELTLLSGKLMLHGPDEGVLVVGHSNTIPELVKWLGVEEPVNIDEANHDDVFIVVPSQGRSPALIRLKY